MVAGADQFRELLQTRPPKDAFKQHHTDALDWRGRASALFKGLGPMEHYRYQAAAQLLESNHPGLVAKSIQEVEVFIREIVHQLAASESNGTGTVIDAGKPYDYYEALSGVISLAHKELFFVDPYADQSFVSTYVRHIEPAIPIRILANKSYDHIVSAVGLLTKQTGQRIVVRRHPNLHDRVIFVDGVRCFYSGASFKDGGAKSATVITEVVDLASVLIAQYEATWAASA